MHNRPFEPLPPTAAEVRRAEELARRNGQRPNGKPIMSVFNQGAHTKNTEHLRENVSILDLDAHIDEFSGRVVLAGIKPEKVDWLWYGRIPYGKLTVLDGDPGLGKSTMLLDLAARISTGTPMPFEKERSKKAKVLILSAEDGLADTLVPRLIAAGANLNMIEARQTVKDDRGERLPQIPQDLPILSTDIEEMGAKLIIIDPLMAYLGGDTNAHNDQQVRRALAPFAALAQRTGAAVVVIRHLNKASGGSAIYRGGGSIGIIGAARSGLLVARDPEDPTERRRILASQKCNLAPPPVALAYFMVQAENGEPRIEWDGETAHTANGLLAAPVDLSEKPALNEACRFLRDLLTDGSRGVTEIKKEARNAGMSDITLRRAKDMLGVAARKQGYGESGYWVWELPSLDEHLNEDAHENPKVIIDFGNEQVNYDSEEEEDIPF